MKECLSKNKAVILCFASIIIASVVCCFLKIGMHIDEVYTFGLSNSHFAPFFSDVFNGSFADKIVTKADIMAYLTVSPDQRFDYASVFYNQSKDTLPPLYSCLINTVSSLVPNTFSLWIGLSINLVIWVLTIYYLFKVLYYLTNNTRVAAVMTAIYGLSPIGLSTMLMIRMYVLCTLFSVLLFYIIVVNEKNEKTKNYILEFLIIYLGALTHYVFVIYAFFVIAFLDLILLKQKQIKKLFKYSVAAVSGIVCMVITFPSVKDQYFADNLVSGETATTQLKSFYCWIQAFKFYPTRTIAGIPIIVFIGIALIIGLLLLILRRNVKSVFMNTEFAVKVITPAVIFSYSLCSITAPCRTERYIYNLVPLIIVVLGYYVYRMYLSLGKEEIVVKLKILKTAVLPMIIVFSVLYGVFVINPSYIYRGKNEYRGYSKVAAEYSDSACVFVGESLNAMTMSLDQIMYFDDVFTTGNPESEKLGEYIESKDNDSLVVYIETDNRIDDVFNPQEVVDTFSKRFPEYKTVKQLYVYGPTEVGTVEAYLFSK